MTKGKTQSNRKRQGRKDRRGLSGGYEKGMCKKDGKRKEGRDRRSEFITTGEQS